MTIETTILRRLAFILCFTGLLGCGPREKPSGRASPQSYDTGDQSFEPLPVSIDADFARAALGEVLFQEPRLSGDSKVSCADCHSAEHGLADGRAHSSVTGRPQTQVNSPTMYNVRFLDRLSWAGKYDSLESHLDALIKNPKVMASSWEVATKHLSEISSYRERFGAVFPEGLTPATVRLAMLEYERSLVTPNAPLDRYLRGDAQALAPEARAGYGLFKSYGCSSCHQGMMIGGNVFERFGVLRDIFADRGSFGEADLGRYNVTHREEDRFVFRVPSLRNVATSAPYFHDGSAATLEEAVTQMAKYQLGRDLDDRDRQALVAFLRALTGEYRGKSL